MQLSNVLRIYLTDWAQSHVEGVWPPKIDVKIVFKTRRGTPFRRRTSLEIKYMSKSLREFEKHTGCLNFKKSRFSSSSSPNVVNIYLGSECGGYGGEVIEDGLNMDYKLCNEELESESWQKTFMHEMFHVFGIGHMMRRKDRAEYVTVLEENINKTYLDQFDICHDCMTYGDFECESIMNYRQGDARKAPGLPTLKVANESFSCPRFSSNEPTEQDWKALRHFIDCKNADLGDFDNNEDFDETATNEDFDETATNEDFDETATTEGFDESAN